MVPERHPSAGCFASGTQQQHNAWRNGMEKMSEVRTLREVPAPMSHCGRPMRKLSGISSGVVRTSMQCEKCGHQELLPAPKPEKKAEVKS
jgi:hypothetical protein